MDPRIILTTALITASAAFSGAVLAQVLSHVFAIRREDRQHLREVYQKLYAPVIFDIFLFLDARSHYTAGHDVVPGSTEALLSKVLSHVSANLTYASPRIISAYHKVKRHEVIDDDMSGYGEEVAIVTFFYSFVDEFSKLLERLALVTEAEQQEIDYRRDLYHIWKLSVKLHRSDRSEVLLRHTWLLDPAKMNGRFRKQLAQWERSQPQTGESWGDYAEQFDEFVIGKLARDLDATKILAEAYASSGYPLAPKSGA